MCISRIAIQRLKYRFLRVEEGEKDSKMRLCIIRFGRLVDAHVLVHWYLEVLDVFMDVDRCFSCRRGVLFWRRIGSRTACRVELCV